MTSKTSERVGGTTKPRQAKAAPYCALLLLAVLVPFHRTLGYSLVASPYRFSQASCRINFRTGKASLFSARRETSPLDNASDDTRTVETLLHQHRYTQRLVTITTDQLPLVAEVYVNGKSEVCRIVSLESAAKKDAPPRAQVQLVSDEEDVVVVKLVDMGQITTVWDQPSSSLSIPSSWRGQVESELEQFPIQHCENCMHRLYSSSHVGRSHSSTATLTKKQVSKLIADNIPHDLQMHAQDVLRKVIKAGPGMVRLVDSSIAMEYLYDDYPTDDDASTRRRLVGAQVLAQDAALGGRFKRMGSIFVSAHYNNDNGVSSVTFVNGGWLAVDQNVRAGTEARKFAGRTEDGKGESQQQSPSKLRTVADERIAQRLECLAMGELFSLGSEERTSQPEDDRRLELDVREALNAMNLPLTPEGAQRALVQIGRWTEQADRVILQPWRRDSLDAGQWYADMDRKRRLALAKQSFAVNRRDEHTNTSLEGRLDLTGLPCVCIDAKRTSFRDDAIGVRQRSSTGRKLIEEASKWEVLIHIADVSDVYSPMPQLSGGAHFVRALQDAAAQRGESRYDLPLGPLHLMPPVALKALSLDTINVDLSGKEQSAAKDNKVVSRCVSVWAYIDERSGKVLDAGLERTLISAPIALDFATATSLLDSELKLNTLRKAQAVLAVAERNILIWNEQHRKRSEAARKREERLASRELVAKMQRGAEIRDDGRIGFQRTRAHRLVDAALDLYGFAGSSLLRRANAPIPRVSGSGASRGGRVGTAPLRRYIDGVAQRQVLSVLCGYGGPPLTKDECVEASKFATDAKNRLNNVRSVKGKSLMPGQGPARQRDALRLLQTQLSGRNGPVSAISSGRRNEVVIEGVGAVAECRGIEDTIEPGDRLLVRVQKLDPEKGALSVVLVQHKGKNPHPRLNHD